jgi:hypothetical protein
MMMQIEGFDIKFYAFTAGKLAGYNTYKLE